MKWWCGGRMLKIFKDIITLIQMPLKKYIYCQIKCLFFMLAYTIFSLAFPGFISVIVDNGIRENNVETVLIQSLLMFLCGMLMIIFQYLQQVSFYKLAQDVIYGIKQKVFKKLVNRNFLFWSKYHVGDVVTILESDIDQIETLLTSTISNLIINLLVAIGVTILLTFINPLIGITVLIMSLIFAYFQREVGSKVQDGMFELRDEMGELSSITNEVVNNLPSIQMMNMVSLEEKKFTKQNTSVVTNFVVQMRKITISQLMGVFFNVFGILWVLIIGAFEVSRNILSVGILFSMTIYVQRLYGPVVSLGDAYINIKKTKPIIDKVLGLLKNEDEILIGNKECQITHGRIIFHKIYFKYQEKWVLKNYSLEISTGETVGIIGENGSGKSTLIRLLSKLCVPQKGNIMIGNCQLNDISYEVLQDNIGIVPQECFLPKGPIREVMKIDNIEKEKKLYDLMQKLGIPITKFENGINTEISENMLNMSGGESQKLCLICSILQDKKIYVFDEPTAAMDIVSENMFCNIIQKYLQEKTVLIVTHRQKVLSVCNRTVELIYEM